MTSETNTPTEADTGGAGELVLAPDAPLGPAADRLVEQSDISERTEETVVDGFQRSS